MENKDLYYNSLCNVLEDKGLEEVTKNELGYKVAGNLYGHYKVDCHIPINMDEVNLAVKLPVKRADLIYAEIKEKSNYKHCMMEQQEDAIMFYKTIILNNIKIENQLEKARVVEKRIDEFLIYLNRILKSKEVQVSIAMMEGKMPDVPEVDMTFEPADVQLSTDNVVEVKKVEVETLDPERKQLSSEERKTKELEFDEQLNVVAEQIKKKYGEKALAGTPNAMPVLEVYDEMLLADELMDAGDIKKFTSAIKGEKEILQYKNEQLMTLTNEIEKMNAELQEKEANISNLWNAYNERKAKERACEERMVVCQNNLATLDKDIEERKVTIEELQKQEGEIRESIATIGERERDLAMNQEILDEQHRIIKEKENWLLSEVNALEDDKAKLIAEIEALRESVAAAELLSEGDTLVKKEVFDELQAEYNETKKAMEVLKEEAAVALEFMENNKDAAIRIQDLQEDLRRADIRKDKIEELYKTSLDQVDIEKESYTKLATEMKELKETIDYDSKLEVAIELLTSKGYAPTKIHDIPGAEKKEDEKYAIMCQQEEFRIIIYIDSNFLFVEKMTNKPKKNEKLVLSLNHQHIMESYVLQSDRVFCKKIYKNLGSDLDSVLANMRSLY